MFIPRAGDWKCNECIKINKKRNTKCFFCRKDKHKVCTEEDILTVLDIINKVYDDKNLRSDDENISIYYNPTYTFASKVPCFTCKTLSIIEKTLR